MAGEGNSVSDRIVAAGLALLEEEGLTALTQTRLVKRSDLRHSPVPHYFPRIDHLPLAITHPSPRQAPQAPPRTPPHAYAAPRDVQFDLEMRTGTRRRRRVR